MKEQNIFFAILNRLKLALPLVLMCCFLLLNTGCSGKNATLDHYNGSGSSGQKGKMPRGSKPYTINGRTYYPLLSANGFREKGVASWYGPNFHGKQTANGEVYNMNGMTAAHKLLPFGSKVRVTNLTNGKSILVRVNDRGPFVDDRIIDLTREGARRIDMLGKGTATVLIEVVGQPSQGGYGTVPTATQTKPATIPQATSSNAGYSSNKQLAYFVQLGAFGDKTKAQNLANALAGQGHKTRLVVGDDKLWRVQAGPYQNPSAADNAAANLRVQFPNNFTLAE